MNRHICRSGSDPRLLAELKRPSETGREKLKAVLVDIEMEILRRGDEALRSYSRRFDRVELGELLVPEAAGGQALAELPAELTRAMQRALDNIARFHGAEIQTRDPEPVETSPGVRCWRAFRPIETVGLYIPGGSAPLFSTALMLGVPALLAGCRNLVFCSPPHPDHPGAEQGIFAAPVILGALALLRKFAAENGLQSRISLYQVGGAQAVFAMARSCSSIPAVDKIYGPGNQYVTEAKIAVSDRVAIDMPAGPSEILIIADSGQNPAVLAADLLAQAEHGPDSQVLLASTCRKTLDLVEHEVLEQSRTLPRRREIQQTLKNSHAVLCPTLEDAVRLSNGYAPEHLLLAVDQFEPLLPQIQNAGSVFCGPLASESFGDYASGTNHTLPTGGFARSYSGLNVQSFGRWITFQQVLPEGLRDLGPTVEILAGAERLQAHKNAVTKRLQQIRDE